MNESANINRWRLVLGRFAQRQLRPRLSREEKRVDRAMDFLYSQEYQGRGVRGTKGGGGSLDPSLLTIPRWVSEIRKLFPKETVKIIESHALNRYQMTDLLKDKDTLKKMEPDMDLLKSLLTFKGHLKGPVLQEVKRIIREVVEDLKKKLQKEFTNTLLGRLNRFKRSPVKIHQNVDWHGTIRKNLKNFDPAQNRLYVENVLFLSRVKRYIPWEIILCVDQSGSMMESIIHSAVLAGIFHSLPMIEVKMVIFDTTVVDLSDQVDDPVEILMSVQLGGGTDIGKALRYCEQCVKNARRTVIVLISDFEEGASINRLLATCKRLHEAGVTLIGLASLDNETEEYYDAKTAGLLADHGMNIAAVTPKRLAEWLAKIIT